MTKITSAVIGSLILATVAIGQPAQAKSSWSKAPADASLRSSWG